MKWWVVAASAVCLAGCDPSPSKLDDTATTTSPRTAPPTAATPVTPSYKADIENLCDVVSRSGATAHDYADRTYLIATWLSGHLTTQEARTFLQKIQPLAGEPKAKVLEAEATRVGLAGCALAAEWRKPSH